MVETDDLAMGGFHRRGGGVLPPLGHLMHFILRMKCIIHTTNGNLVDEELLLVTNVLRVKQAARHSHLLQ